MSTVLENKAAARGGLADRLAFFNGLQTVTNRIHATTHSDEIILDLGQDICNLFGADRLTIYVACDGGKSIVTKVKTGLNAYKDFKLPVADLSVAGYVAVHRRIVNIRDVYDANELAAYSPHPNFLRLIDTKTGYRTRQMLVAPVADAQTGDLVGVVQLINTKSGEPFPPAMEEGVALLCETLAIALSQRLRGAAPVKGRYDALVANAVMSAEELELATRSARRKNLDVETVLIDEFQVKPDAIGEALAAYFGVPYEPFRGERVKPFDLLKNLSREFLESSLWVPIEDAGDGMVVLTTDPDRLRGSRVVNNIYPKGKIRYRVCCNREFTATLDHLVEHLVERELIFAGPFRDEPADVAAMVPDKGRGRRRMPMPRIVREDAQQIAVVGARRIDRIMLELLLIVLAQCRAERAQRLDLAAPRQHGPAVGDFRHQLVHVLQLLQCRPALVSLPPVRARSKPDRERLGEILVRMTLRIPEPEMLDKIPTRRIGPVIARIARR